MNGQLSVWCLMVCPKNRCQVRILDRSGVLPLTGKFWGWAHFLLKPSVCHGQEHQGAFDFQLPEDVLVGMGWSQMACANPIFPGLFLFECRDCNWMQLMSRASSKVIFIFNVVYSKSVSLISCISFTIFYCQIISLQTHWARATGGFKILF